MRFLIVSMIMSFGVAGFCQETGDASPAEVTTSDEGSCDDVAVSDSLRMVRDFDCGCNKDKKPKA